MRFSKVNNTSIFRWIGARQFWGGAAVALLQEELVGMTLQQGVRDCDKVTASSHVSLNISSCAWRAACPLGPPKKSNPQHSRINQISLLAMAIPRMHGTGKSLALFLQNIIVVLIIFLWIIENKWTILHYSIIYSPTLCLIIPKCASQSFHHI